MAISSAVSSATSIRSKLSRSPIIRAARSLEIGEINMAAILAKVHDLGFRGLVELEHVWSSAGLDAERRALAWLTAIDEGLAQNARSELP